MLNHREHFCSLRPCHTQGLDLSDVPGAIPPGVDFCIYHTQEEVTVAVNDQDPYSFHQMDSDPAETAEWQESLDAVVTGAGHQRGREIMLSLLKRSKELHLGVPMVPTTDYLNSIAPDSEPEFPGDEEIERRYRAWIRWNAAITVHRAQRPGISVGGHISTYASSAALYEVCLLYTSPSPRD